MHRIYRAFTRFLARLVACEPAPGPLDRLSARELADLPPFHECERC